MVLYADDARGHEHQYTVLTAARGALRGQRVVAGREHECRAANAGAGLIADRTTGGRCPAHSGGRRVLEGGEGASEACVGL